MSGPITCPRAARLHGPLRYCPDCPEGPDCELRSGEWQRAAFKPFYCKVCLTDWVRWDADGSWSFDPRVRADSQPCCDNAPMGSQMISRGTGKPFSDDDSWITHLPTLTFKPCLNEDCDEFAIAGSPFCIGHKADIDALDALGERSNLDDWDDSGPAAPESRDGETITCASCRFWFLRHDRTNTPQPSMGECTRYPPVPVAVDGKVVTAFPDTEEFNGCGEHQPCQGPF